jgi:hypothetical protein
LDFGLILEELGYLRDYITEFADWSNEPVVFTLRLHRRRNFMSPRALRELVAIALMGGSKHL